MTKISLGVQKILAMILVMAAVHACASSPQTELKKDLDCRVYTKERPDRTTEFLVGDLRFQTTPKATQIPKEDPARQNVIQELVNKYINICQAYNKGSLNSTEYDIRRNELETAYKGSEGQLIILLPIPSTQGQISSSPLERDQGFDPLDSIPAPSGPRGAIRPPLPRKPSSITGSTGVTPREQEEATR